MKRKNGAPDKWALCSAGERELLYQRLERRLLKLRWRYFTEPGDMVDGLTPSDEGLVRLLGCAMATLEVAGGLSDARLQGVISRVWEEFGQQCDSEPWERFREGCIPDYTEAQQSRR